MSGPVSPGRSAVDTGVDVRPSSTEAWRSAPIRPLLPSAQISPDTDRPQVRDRSSQGGDAVRTMVLVDGRYAVRPPAGGESRTSPARVRTAGSLGRPRSSTKLRLPSLCSVTDRVT